MWQVRSYITNEPAQLGLIPRANLSICPQGGLVRISGTFLHTASATGRLATEAPNLQCIPRPRSFQVQDTATPADGGPKGMHAHAANLRWAHKSCAAVSSTVLECSAKMCATFTVHSKTVCSLHVGPLLGTCRSPVCLP